jgi:Uma2 family endonuclease
MIVNATDLKNNLGKYLRDCKKENIIIASNGRKIALLCAYEEDRGNKYRGNNTKVNYDGLIRERAEAFDYAPRRVSYEEFLALTEGNEKRYEYIDGEVYLLTSPKTIHQKALGELHILFYNWFKDKKCRPMLAPYDITLKKGHDNINVVEPDLVVICDLEENLNENDFYMGTPALVVEIISESTRSKDTIKKLDLYMSTGVSEYWTVNPLNREITIYFFEQNDIVKNETYKKNEVAASYIFAGLKVNLKDIF